MNKDRRTKVPKRTKIRESEFERVFLEMKVVHRLLTVAVAWWLRQGGAPPLPRQCEYKCGAVAIPYPFGLETNCARSEKFLLNCSNTEGSGLQLQWGNVTIRRISVGDSTMVVSHPEAYQCYDQNGMPLLANNSGPLIIDLSTNPRYRFSDTQNKLTVLGCDIIATMAESQGTFGSGCIAYCSENETVDLAKETTCSGRGCCQASIPKGLQKLDIRISFVGAVSASRSNSCALAFVADNKSFNVSGRTLPRFEDVGKGEELVLDWMVEPDVNCQKAEQNKSSYACGKNTSCVDFGNGPGYRCVCKPGYHGNPYDPRDGCIDIDECKDPKTYPCHGKCRNTPGSYTCDCGPGKRRRGKDRCQVSRLGIAFGAMAVSVFGLTVTASVSLTMRWKLRKINFRRNGGEILEILEQQGAQIFPEAKLVEATNNYDDSNKLRDDDFGSVHRGNIAGDDIVVVRKPKDAHKSRIKRDFQRELEFLMKRSHKNVVKLKGICLETRIPLLVYEYIPNGTLFEHIHQDESTILKSWEDRFKIAAEAALALSYMHSSIKPPIVHGNIKSANILLDQNDLDQSYSAKVSDVGTSVLISPKHKYIVATQKQDSLGYIDPEYLITRILTTESDVYSFGVILVELLTGKELFDTKSGGSINMIHHFISSVKGNELSDVIDFKGASDDEMERVEKVAKIAVECLDQRRTNRPAMREVAWRLAVIHRGSAAEEVEENIEEIWDAEKPYPRETSAPGDECEQCMSSCLSCLGMD
ncbi:wall-associated receptor kinase 2-like [Syzygium oleosum]|uniref:wall-associated receptor kinase 2-like n=1 Tax=Syzygium oleosum TaxID=219896 RepID=UPI0011D2AC68|nr:wall-associated receptor kinase 2-like [Syzygium oleosum]